MSSIAQRGERVKDLRSAETTYGHADPVLQSASAGLCLLFTAHCRGHPRRRGLVDVLQLADLPLDGSAEEWAVTLPWRQSRAAVATLLFRKPSPADEHMRHRSPDPRPGTAQKKAIQKTRSGWL